MGVVVVIPRVVIVARGVIMRGIVTAPAAKGRLVADKNQAARRAGKR